jgi:hypothetical protein
MVFRDEIPKKREPIGPAGRPVNARFGQRRFILMQLQPRDLLGSTLYV